MLSAINITYFLKVRVAQTVIATGTKRNLSFPTTHIFAMFAVAQQSTQNSLEAPALFLKNKYRWSYAPLPDFYIIKR